MTRSLDDAMGMTAAERAELRARVEKLADCPSCGREHHPEICGAGAAGCDCCADMQAEEDGR